MDVGLPDPTDTVLSRGWPERAEGASRFAYRVRTVSTVRTATAAKRVRTV